MANYYTKVYNHYMCLYKYKLKGECAMETRIEIVNDDSVVITYQDIKVDTVNRQEVAEIENAIAVLEQEVSEKNAKIEELKAKVEFAKKIIAMADEKKANEIEEVVA